MAMSFGRDAGRPGAWVAWAGLALAAVVGPAGCGPGADSGQDVARRLDEAIRAEVPAAATKAQAEAWLDARGLSHHYVAGPPGGRLGQQSWAQVAGLRDEDVGGTVWIE